MRAYLDSGIFIDYLIGREHAGTYLRAADRRGRSPAQLGEDAEASLTLLATKHEALTSCLTCYEVEEAMYRELKSSTSGVPNANKYLIVSARPAVIQTLMTVDTFRIKLVELTKEVIRAQCGDLALQMRGVRAADALHVTTALLHDAELLLSADEDILKLDGELRTIKGKVLRCLDTDAGISLLRSYS